MGYEMIASWCPRAEDTEGWARTKSLKSTAAAVMPLSRLWLGFISYLGSSTCHKYAKLGFLEPFKWSMFKKER
jgi:hypothetical protein